MAPKFEQHLSITRYEAFQSSIGFFHLVYKIHIGLQRAKQYLQACYAARVRYFW